ncbi:MAG: SMI1/KNR4 family protein [Planctomycetota bacterium]
MGQWVENLYEFYKSIWLKFGPEQIGSFDIKPPLSTSELAELKNQFGGDMPDSLVEFYKNEARYVEFYFSVAWVKGPPYGGPPGGVFTFFDPLAQDPYANPYQTRNWQEIYNARSSRFGRRLDSTFVFCNIGNNDCIGIEINSSITEPPVVYIPCVPEEFDLILPPIAPNLNSFLHELEMLCYGDPMTLINEGCVNRDGFLEHTVPAAQSIRRWYEENGIRIPQN